MPDENAQLERLQQERDELHDRLLRTAAELENWRKRSQREAENFELRVRSSILHAVLPIADNLERALAHAVDEDPVAVGVRLVERQLASMLERQGVTRFQALGERFDPSRHEAIDQVETTKMPPGMVVQVRTPGYLIDGRLLRPAQVVVSKRPAAEASKPMEQP